MTVPLAVAICAEGNQIVFGIFPRVTAKLLVMEFQVRHGTAELASPAVALKNALAEFFVVVSSQPDRHLLLQKLIHCVLSFTSCCTKACLCSPGRN